MIALYFLLFKELPDRRAGLPFGGGLAGPGNFR